MSILARLFRRPSPRNILPMDPAEEKLLARQREARAAKPISLRESEKSDLLEVVPLDERIVEGRYYVVTTGDREFFHVAKRKDGEWRYGPHGPAIEDEVTGYCAADGPPLSGSV